MRWAAAIVVLIGCDKVFRIDHVGLDAPNPAGPDGAARGDAVRLRHGRHRIYPYVRGWAEAGPGGLCGTSSSRISVAGAVAGTCRLAPARRVAVAAAGGTGGVIDFGAPTTTLSETCVGSVPNGGKGATGLASGKDGGVYLVVKVGFFTTVRRSRPHCRSRRHRSPVLSRDGFSITRRRDIPLITTDDGVTENDRAWTGW